MMLRTGIVMLRTEIAAICGFYRRPGRQGERRRGGFGRGRLRSRASGGRGGASPSRRGPCPRRAGGCPGASGRGRRPSRARREAVRSVQAVAQSLPAGAWHTYQLREGACGPLVFQFAAVRVWAVRHRKPGPPIWLMIRRSLGPDPEVKYYVSNAAADTPLEALALVSGCRFRVEEYLEEGKSYLGMAQYEARSWSSWHHHMSLVALAHLFVTLTRLRLKKKRPS